MVEPRYRAERLDSPATIAGDLIGVDAVGANGPLGIVAGVNADKLLIAPCVVSFGDEPAAIVGADDEGAHGRVLS